MSSGARMVHFMQQAGKTPENKISDILVGEVISLSPYKIKVDKLEITETFLIFSALTQPFQIPNSDPIIPLWRGLQMNDKVYLIRVADGQKYFVLQRVEGLTL